MQPGWSKIQWHSLTAGCRPVTWIGEWRTAWYLARYELNRPVPFWKQLGDWVQPSDPVAEDIAELLSEYSDDENWIAELTQRLLEIFLKHSE